MYNLIQLQDEIKNLPLADVQKYANGSNPQVPPYIALSEMMRRKQIESTQSAFEGQQPTVKDQLSNALTKPSQFANDPTKQGTHIDMTRQQGVINPALAKQQVNPTAPVNAAALLRGQNPNTPQVDPTGEQQAQQMVQAAQGGLMHFADGGFVPGIASLNNQQDQQQYSQPPNQIQQNFQQGQPTSFWGQPQFIPQQSNQQISQNQPQSQPQQQGVAGIPTPNMFQQQSFAGGGIVAFGEGGSAFSEDIDKAQKWLVDKFGYSAPPEEKPSWVQSGIDYFTKPRPTPSADADAQSGGLYGQSGSADTSVPPISNTPSGQIAPSTVVQGAKPVSNAQANAINNRYAPPVDLTDEQLFERRKNLEKMAGVSQDPYADTKARYDKIEARQQEQYADNPLNRLIAQAIGIGKADPTKGWAYAVGAGGEASQTLERAQQDLQNKQENSMADLHKEMNKEEDARKRGSVTGVEAARAAQEKTKLDLAKLENERRQTDAMMINATKAPAEMQMLERIMKDKGVGFTDALNIYNSEKRSSQSLDAARKEYATDISLRQQYKTFDEYARAIGLGGGSTGNTPQYAVNPNTKERIVSTDGGRTWQPVGAK